MQSTKTVMIKDWIPPQNSTRSCYLSRNPCSWHDTTCVQCSGSANNRQGPVTSPRSCGQSVPAVVAMLSCSFVSEPFLPVFQGLL